MKDPTEWMNDPTFYMDDSSLADTAATIEPTLLYGGSKAAAGAWIGLAGIVGGAFGGITLSPAIRQPLAFIGYLVAAVLVVRGVHLLTVRLLGTAVGWLAGLAMFWTVLLGLSAVLGARVDAALWAYAISLGCGGFIGLMYGAITPGVTRREDLWMITALPLAPLASGLATYVLRRTPGLADSLEGAALAGAIAGGLLAVPMGALLARVWDEAEGLGQMGLLYLHNPNFAPKAIAYFDRAIAVDPHHGHYYSLRGVAWSRMDDPERATADWDKASALSPDDPEPYLNRGTHLLERGAVTEAIASFEAALERAPASGKVQRALGSAWARQGNLDRAIEHYDRAITLAADDARAYVSRGYAFSRKGDLAQALRDCERAVALAPELGLAHVSRGDVLAALGHADAAAEAYRDALDLEPEPSVRQQALRGLESSTQVSTERDEPA
jgi:tetratricopeptide (TPR) repeat protein